MVEAPYSWATRRAVTASGPAVSSSRSAVATRPSWRLEGVSIATKGSQQESVHNTVIAMTTNAARLPWSLSRVGFWVVALVAVGYFPLAFTYFWHYFVPGAPMLQD